MNKNHVENNREESISDHLKNNHDLIFLEYYSIKKDSMDINIDKESKETKSDLILSSS